MERNLAEQQFSRAKEPFHRGEAGEALALLGALEESFPNDHRILYAQAECLAALGRRHEALLICARLPEELASPRATDLLRNLRDRLLQATDDD